MRVLLTFTCDLDHPPLPRPSLATGRNGQQYYTKGPAYQSYKQTIAQAARLALPEDWVLYNGPAELRIIAQFNQAQRPKIREAEEWHLKPPDNDNLVKGIQDALTKVVWFDDRTVPALRFAKIWGPSNKIIVRVIGHNLHTGQRLEAYEAAGLEDML